MSTVFTSLAASLDGYIQSKDGDLGWLNQFMAKGEDYGFEATLKRTGAYIMGANTYHEMAGMAGSGATPVYVVTHNQSLKTNRHTHVYSGDLDELVRTIKAGLAPDKDIYLFGGGQLLTQFIEQNLLDELSIAIVPIILGEGIPLFRHFSLPKRLLLTKHQTYASGMILLDYRLSR
jgi:dihydrofolate reductase